MKIIIIAFTLASLSVAQRPSYAGRSAIGYPNLQKSTTEVSNSANSLNGIQTTTMKLPPEALGDAAMVNRLRKLPEDQQPFWLLNQRAIEDNNNNPHTFNQDSNSFISARSE